MWAKKESWKERWLIVPLLPSCQLGFCQQRIHERWKPSTPLAQIPLCTHKHRNSTKITKSKNFSHPHDPKSFLNTSGKDISFGRGVAFTSAFVHQSLVRKSLWWTVCAHIFVYKCVYLRLCVCVLKTAERLRQWRERERELIRNQCFCFLCLGFVPEMKGSGGGGVGAGAWIFIWVSPRTVEGLPCPYYGWVRASSVVPVTSQKQQRSETGMVPIRMEHASICLSQKKKNPD